VECYSHADYAGDVDGRRSTSDMWASANGGAVSWRSKMQTVVATRTCGAEKVAVFRDNFRDALDYKA
jgi:hypothetical protein